MKCFYHSADLDGRCSGAIVKRRFPDCEMVGIDYGERFPSETVYFGEPIIMVDFSLQPWGDMVMLNNLAMRLTWIDHHKSAIEEYRNSPIHGAQVSYALDRAACELAWEFYFPDQPMPEAVYLLGRYDIWKHAEVPGALEFQYGMGLIDDTAPEAAIWSDLLVAPGRDTYASLNAQARTIEIKQQGAVALRYQRQQNAAFCRAYAFETEMDGLRCIAANRGMSNSLLFESVWDREKYDAMLMFAWKHGSWTVSLYSDRPDVDVSVVCKARGGGGHKGAAGFQCSELPFLAPAPGTHQPI